MAILTGGGVYVKVHVFKQTTFLCPGVCNASAVTVPVNDIAITVKGATVSKMITNVTAVLIF